MSILDHYSDEIEKNLDHPTTIIEYGSGSSAKIKKLLDDSKKIIRYIPIDISKEHLLHSVNKLASDYPKLDICAVCADYTDPNSLEEIRLHEANRKVVFFPGSTIGNLEVEEAQKLLINTKKLIGDDGEMIIGIDLVKNRETLVKAYDDAKGVTQRSLT